MLDAERSDLKGRSRMGMTRYLLTMTLNRAQLTVVWIVFETPVRLNSMDLDLVLAQRRDYDAQSDFAVLR